MSTNTRSIPISSERSRPRRDTSTRPRSSAGTWTRRPSALMAMATRLRFRLLNRPNVVLRKLTHTGPYGPRCPASVPAEVKLCATPHSGRVTGEVSPARRDTEGAGADRVARAGDVERPGDRGPPSGDGTRPGVAPDDASNSPPTRPWLRASILPTHWAGSTGSIGDEAGSRLLGRCDVAPRSVARLRPFLPEQANSSDDVDQSRSKLPMDPGSPDRSGRPRLGLWSDVPSGRARSAHHGKSGRICTRIRAESRRATGSPGRLSPLPSPWQRQWVDASLRASRPLRDRRELLGVTGRSAGGRATTRLRR